MSVSLYRKYRPARFEDIVGQDHIARTLVNAIIQDRVSHAYLFTGPRGTGKTSTAKILAMALNCDAGLGKPTPAPDGTCPHCEAIRKGSALDVVEMDAASNRGIDDIRDLRDKVHFAPVESRMKVYIVDEVHMLTTEAFNALLKTLEEPPAHAVFVLATTEPHKVPATILSRCQRFDFRRPSIPEVVEVLASVAKQEGIEVAETALTAMARAAGGSFRDAIGTLDQLAVYSGGSIGLDETLDVLGVVRHDLLFEVVDLVNEHDTQGALLFVERMNLAGTDFNQFMKDLLGHLRDLYVIRHTEDTPASVALSEEQLEILRSQAKRIPIAKTIAFIDLLGEALRSVRQGSEARLELELALIKLTALGPRASIPADVAVGDTPTQAPPQTSAPTSPPRTPPTSAPTQTPSETRPPRVAGDDDAPVEAARPQAPSTPAAPPQAPTDEAQRPTRTVQADVEHLRRAWTVVLDSVKKRQAGLAAVLSEGRPESIRGDELLVRFPAGYGFQAKQVSRGDNQRVISDALKEVTGRALLVVAQVTAGPAETTEDARILSRDELIRVLKQEFDAEIIDDGPPR